MDGRLFVVLRYRHRKFDDATADRFANPFLDRLRVLCRFVQQDSLSPAPPIRPARRRVFSALSKPEYRPPGLCCL